ncbi:MAG: lamin tail domain-containing protein [Gracilimonas sp.]|uniref:lamin tail domain-containing protein n=1 Tax=Gracilimonas sp. TaxID=1974203 RepID=UPI001985C4AE|nr:lamin tail domain-containing protein [Gracilimonas sp.]MBD3617806.1 lamin tail domain-containing protein [Gracilimonas sp.]
MKKLLIVLLFTIPSIAVAQTANFEDDFSDKDISDWSGNNAHFTFIDESKNILLQQNAPDAGTSYLSIPSVDIEGYWEFFIRMEFAPSDGNKAEIYLMSDSSDFNGSLNGYKILAGEDGSNDVFRLFRIDSGSEASEIITGTTNISNGGDYRVKVTRDASGNWTLEVAEGYAGALAQEGTGTDSTYTAASHFGFKTIYTSTRSDLFAFDFKIDIPPIEITSVSPVSNTEIDIVFSHAFDSSTVESTDFTLNPGSINPQSVTHQTADTARITFSDPLSGGIHDLSVSGINNLSGETTLADTTLSFIIFDDYQPGDIIINEFMKDPPTGTAEYVELKNISGRYINLRDWQVGDNNSQTTIIESDFAILPDSFAVISADTSSLNTYYGNANYIQTSLPALNNGGDQVRIFDPTGTIADSLEYTSEWGGLDVSIERRDTSVSSTFRENWGDSPAGNFGTPGFANLVAEDTTAPAISELLVQNNQTILLVASERLETTSAETTGNYSLDQNPETGAVVPTIPAISSATQIAADTVELTLSSNLEEYDGNWILSADSLTDIFENTANDQAEFTFTNPFTIMEVSALSESEILFLFSDNIEFATVSTEDFTINGEVLAPSSNITQPETNQLIVNLPTSLPSGPNLAVVSNIESVNGWIIPQNTQAEFFVFDDYQSGDILINEFMKDPPTGAVEYVELKNISGKYLNLRDWRIGDNNSITSITGSDFVILPDSFTVISADTVALSIFFGEANYVQTSLPALNNSGDQIRLFDNNGTLADSLEYTSDWGGEDVAIERRDATVSSTFRENWGDSPAENFGTPGLTNLVAPDVTAPELLSIQRPADDQIQLSFSERLKESTARDSTNFTLSADGLSEPIPALQSATLATPSSITLQYEFDLPSEPSGTAYELSVANQTDIFGNTAVEIPLSFFVILYATADSADVFITEFMYSPATGFTDFIEIFNPTDSAYNLQDWTYNDNAGNARAISDSEFTLAPNSHAVLAPDSTIAKSFPNITLADMGSRFANLNSTTPDDIVLRNQSGTLIDSLTYAPSWGGREVSLERRSIDVPPLFQENWGESPSDNFATPGAPNEIQPDTSPPEIASLTVLNDSTFRMIFSERIQPEPAENEANYTLLEPEGLPSAPPLLESVEFLAPDTVIISFQNALHKQEQGSEYGLITEGQLDIFGNVASILEDSFFLIDIAQADSGDVVINEFIYDPGAEFSEFIELHNSSDKNFDLRDWTFNDNTGTRLVITNTSVELVTGSYVILAPDSTIISLFPDRPIIVMGNKFPALNNGSDDIVIRDQSGILIDSLTYFSEWGGDKVSLERRSPAAPSYYRENWGDSPSNELATPGAANQIQPDNNPPEIINAFTTSSDSIQITFSERIDSVLAKNKSNFSILPAVSIAEIAEFSGNTVTVVLETFLTDGETYTLIIENQADIFGNVQASLTVELQYIEFSTANFGDVIINEILYRKKNADSEEFVELYNRSERNFNLGNWTLSDARGSTTLPEGTEIRSGEYLILTGLKSFASEVQNGVYLPSFPSLNDDEDAVVIRNEVGILIDSLFYSNTWGQNERGVSLERKDPESASNDASNWASNISEIGNSAGYQSSIFEPDETPPEIIFSRLQSNGTIFVAFSEFVNIDNASAFINDQPAPIISYSEANGNIVILEKSASGSASVQVKEKIKENEPLHLTFNNITDIRGNANQELAVEVSQPLAPGAVVINEILYNPLANSDDNLPDQTEYVELYNPSDYAISLEGFYLHDELDENGEVRALLPVSTHYKWIPANGYVVVYAEDQATTFNESRLAKYFKLQGESDQFKARINRSSLSLTNSDDAVYLADSTAAIIDSVFYDESWQNPNLYDTDGVALERINPEGPSNDKSNWSSSTRVNGGTPGEQNSIFQESGAGPVNTGITFTPNPFSPDDDGFEDNLFINYKLDESDYLLRVHIFDRYGRKVRKLADGFQAGFEGSLIWDGRTDDNRNNRVGIYIVLFEAYNSAIGKNVTFKETVVLARKF